MKHGENVPKNPHPFGLLMNVLDLIVNLEVLVKQYLKIEI